MIKSHVFTSIGITLLITLGTSAWFMFSNTQLSKNEEKSIDKTDVKEIETSPASLLSEDAEYPTPVQQLQKVVAHGLVNADAPKLPLLRGDLEQFSQKNIPEDISLPDELTDLKARLHALKQNTSSPTENQ